MSEREKAALREVLGYIEREGIQVLENACTRTGLTTIDFWRKLAQADFVPRHQFGNLFTRWRDQF